MKIKRFVGQTMREAIRLVREEQGPEAVILSNRRVDGGIEVVAAVDYDEALIRNVARNPQPAQAETQMQASASVATVENAALPASQAAPVAASTPQIVWADEQGISKLRRDLGGLRRLVETQLAQLTMGQFRNAQPLRAAVLRELVRIGIELPLAREISEGMPDDVEEVAARRLPLTALAQRLPIAEDELFETGGVFALIGPTGVGKTTTLAKLAARYATRHGIRQVALISTDHYRVGAQDQLYTYGRRLGVPVYCADDAASLASRLDELSDCRLVLIDTAGLGPRDARLPGQLAELNVGKRPVKSFLVLAANSPAPDLEQTVKRFSTPSLCSAILTKLDESSRPGAALSVLIRNQLPLAYVCDGQRVPEDLRRAEAWPLVAEAVRLARCASADIQNSEIEEEIDASALAFA